MGGISDFLKDFALAVGNPEAYRRKMEAQRAAQGGATTREQQVRREIGAVAVCVRIRRFFVKQLFSRVEIRSMKTRIVASESRAVMTVVMMRTLLTSSSSIVHQRVASTGT